MRNSRLSVVQIGGFQPGWSRCQHSDSAIYQWIAKPSQTVHDRRRQVGCCYILKGNVNWRAICEQRQYDLNFDDFFASTWRKTNGLIDKQPGREQCAIRWLYRDGCVIIKFYDGLLLHSAPDQAESNGGLDCRPHMYSRNRGRIQDTRGAQCNHRTVNGVWNMQILLVVKSDG